MGKLLDRHQEDGTISVPSLYSIGRIIMGKRLSSGSFENWPYFMLKPKTTIKEEADDLLAQAHAAINKWTPGQDPARPTLLCVTVLSGDEGTFADAAYKLKGTGGKTNCLGDGQTLRYMTGAKNTILVSDGRTLMAFEKDGRHFDADEEPFCPGSRKTDRYPWCEKCRAELTIKVAIFGAINAGIWLHSTTDRRFYDGFWTAIQQAQEWVEQGLLENLIGVPFYLRRTPPVERNVPLANDDGSTRLIRRAMPGLAFQIHPQFADDMMRIQREARGWGLGEGTIPATVKAITSGDLPTWEEAGRPVGWSVLSEAIIKHLQTPRFGFTDKDHLADILKDIIPEEHKANGEAIWNLTRDYVLSYDHVSTEQPAGDDQPIEGEFEEVELLPREAVETAEPPEPEPEQEDSPDKFREDFAEEIEAGTEATKVAIPF